jgi:hypothetical protein
MMPEYLEKEAFKSWLKKNITKNPMILTAVDYAPPADVESVRHGHWTETVIPGEVPDYDCVCSLCGKSGLPIYNFCPNCGARMDEENSE